MRAENITEAIKKGNAALNERAIQAIKNELQDFFAHEIMMLPEEIDNRAAFELFDRIFRAKKREST